jgi:hypothetical protein
MFWVGVAKPRWPMSASEPIPAAFDYIPYFETLILIQEKAITSFKRWAGGLVFTGLCIIVLALVLNTRLQGVASQIIGIGGLFIGGLATFPYKEIAPRRSRIVTYGLLKRSFERFLDLSDDDRRRLRDLADETIKRQL